PPAPPPTPLYTLSLHDALPISAAHVNSFVTEPIAKRVSGVTFSSVRGETTPQAFARITRPSCITPTERPTKRFSVIARETRRSIDRKSTRLNSSHRTISYAVFC